MSVSSTRKTPVRKIPKKITESYLHNAGLYYLERFSASKTHFIGVLSRKVKRSCAHHKEQDYETCLQMVRTVADKFEAAGLLNDTLYTDGMVTSLRRRGLSGKAILNKLHLKGIVPQQTVLSLQKIDALNTDHPEGAELQAALTLARKKKIGPFNLNRNGQDKHKALGVFARAGFSYEIAMKVINMAPEEAGF